MSEGREKAAFLFASLTPLIPFQCCPLENFIEKFDSALTRYMAALQSIVPIFIYMVRCVSLQHVKSVWFL